MSNTKENILNELGDLKSDLKKLENKLVNIIDTVKALSLKDSGEVLEMRKPSEVVELQAAREKGEEKPVEGRSRCSQCDSLQFSEVEDKSNVLYYQSGTPIYAKKKKCKQCGYEF